MPAILERLVNQLRAKGHNEQAAYAIATSALKRAGNLTSSGKATKKGKRRGAMSPGARARDRAARYSKGRHKASDYTYKPDPVNRAILKK